MLLNDQPGLEEELDPESGLPTEATGVFHLLRLLSCFDFVRERRARDISQGNGLNTHTVNSCARNPKSLKYSFEKRI